MELLAIEVNELNLVFIKECDQQRIVKSELASTTSTKRERKRRGEERKRKRAYDEDQPSYVGGGL